MALDAGSGIFAAILTSWFFGVELSWALIVAGIIFTFLPDIDYLVHLARGGTSKNAHRHREILHYPLLFIPVGTLLIYFFGIEWAFLFGVAAFIHFLHDSIGIGWGVKWWWPSSGRSYKFFAEKDGSFSRRLLVFWEKDELPKVVAKYGDPDWIKNVYLRPTAVSIIEFVGLLLALIFLYFWWA